MVSGLKVPVNSRRPAPGWDPGRGRHGGREAGRRSRVRTATYGTSTRAQSGQPSCAQSCDLMMVFSRPDEATNKICGERLR